MLRTYKAVLTGNQIEWVDSPPPSQQSMPVHVTVLQEEEAQAPIVRGPGMARALEEIAKAGGLSSISDPAEWQRELRRDRPLPLRES
jgi:hypothetical protein